MVGYYDNHSIAYCLLGYLCAYYRYYHPIEFITALLNNAANDDDIVGGTNLARLYGIRVSSPRFGASGADYAFDKERKVIAKGLASVKFISAESANGIQLLSRSREYRYFSDLVYDLEHQANIDARQLSILIDIDFFIDFGNQRELQRIVEMYGMFKGGDAKKISRASIEGTMFEEIVARFSNGFTKSGELAKSFTPLDIWSIIHNCEDAIKSIGLPDFSVVYKAKKFAEVMGYNGYASGLDSDRPKLYVREIFPVCRKKDGKQFGYNILTSSLGSGIESKFTIMNRVYDKDPVQKGDVIYAKSYDRDGQYFTLTSYYHVTEYDA